MFKKILIANRGEIAVRVIRACRDMGIISVAVYSEADRDSMHSNIADESLCIGGAMAKDSYLNLRAIITAAQISGADAIHPGYGFLSENTVFVKLCEENNIKFIGPNAKSIALMGNKAEAKIMMQKSGVPVIPGSDGAVYNLPEAEDICDKIGYPVMIKASGGGGGRGIRLVSDKNALKNAYNMCKAEAKASFGNDDIYIEKFIENPRHIEIQILADEHGKIIYLFERDCSLQRRHQKIMEEAPSVFMDENLRRKMGDAAIKATKAANYFNAGTVEFLVDKNKNFYFMEMNTRIQVEHPVTEFITGIDIVKQQIKIAAGEPLELAQSDVKLLGHAIECRINAEDPDKNFAPCPGKITELNVPGGPGVRVDSAVYQGYNIPPYYDSMISKLIVFGNNRDEAIARMRRALAEYLFEGIITNVDYQIELLSTEEFQTGDFNINFVDEYNKRRRENING
ncbi:MAG: acetyl-CoA carboxylase biotin carboxylase subunit [Oscillospiraceae bacterium]|nr:acetyl-CoA carboxylase biotin carboxylase subunit [Oscillospiraceae bacterium]